MSSSDIKALRLGEGKLRLGEGKLRRGEGLVRLGEPESWSLGVFKWLMSLKVISF